MTSDAPARSPLNIEISATIPLQDFFGQCQHTDWIGLWRAILGLPTGTDGVSSQWQRVEATPLRAKVPPLAHPTLTPQPIKSPLRYPGISDRHLNRPMPQPFLYRP